MVRLGFVGFLKTFKGLNISGVSFVLKDPIQLGLFSFEGQH